MEIDHVSIGLGDLCSFAFISVFTGIALYILVNKLFGKTHLVRCVKEIPNVNLSLWMLMWIARQIPIAPPQAVLLHLACGLCYLYEKSRIFCVWFCFRPAVVFYKPETVEIVLNNSKTINKSIEYNIVRGFLGDGLITFSGEKWRHHRKTINPAFHSRILEDFLIVFNEQSMVLVKNLLEEGKKEKYFDLEPFSKSCTFDIICESAMGVQMRAQTSTCNEFFKAVSQIEENFAHIVLRPWLWSYTLRCFTPMGRAINNGYRIIHDTTLEVMKKKIAAIRENENSDSNHNLELNSTSGKKRKAFLDLLLECRLKNGSLTDDDVLNELTTFMLAGHDTTAIVLSFTMHTLGLHSDIQNKVIQEIDSIFGNDSARPITTNDLNLMKYTECVIKENLRLYPPAPMFGRSVTEDVKVLDYTIPPGVMCFIFPLMLHRDPESFPDPEKFDPERFFPENCAKRHPCAFIPFSAGPRSCIGKRNTLRKYMLGTVIKLNVSFEEGKQSVSHILRIHKENIPRYFVSSTERYVQGHIISGQKYAMMELKVLLANIFRNMKVSSLDKLDSFHLMPSVILKNVSPLRIKITPRSKN